MTAIVAMFFSLYALLTGGWPGDWMNVLMTLAAFTDIYLFSCLVIAYNAEGD